MKGDTRHKLRIWFSAYWTQYTNSLNPSLAAGLLVFEDPTQQTVVCRRLIRINTHSLRLLVSELFFTLTDPIRQELQNQFRLPIYDFPQKMTFYHASYLLPNSCLHRIWNTYCMFLNGVHAFDSVVCWYRDGWKMDHARSFLPSHLGVFCLESRESKEYTSECSIRT